MNWKLIIVSFLIFLLILMIIVVSVVSSVQRVTVKTVQNYEPTQEPKQEVKVQTRDLTTPYKLPPSPQDEELWFDEIMKSNRLKPPNSTVKQYPQRVQIDSGNFRVQLATIWDPHPTYKFRAFNKDWKIHLSPNDSGFIGPGFRVTEHGVNESVVGRTRSDISGCFYNGVVEGDPGSSISVSLCHGMTGHIRTRNGSYFIEPTGEWKGPHVPILHIIYKLPVQPVHQDDDLLTSVNSTVDKTSKDVRNPVHIRRKRSMSRERYVELMVAADSTMTSYHGNNLRHYILTLLSIVALVYRDASIGNPINIALVNLHVLTNKDFGRKSLNGTSGLSASQGLSASDMLRNFCKWQKDMNELDDGSGMHHDTALLLTRETICRNPWLGKCDTLGLAELGTMCDHYASCALVQDNGLSAAFTIAHELGHVMNMPHDDDYKCSSFGTTSPSTPSSPAKMSGHYVMSRMLDHNTYPWAWSLCSRHFLTEFLDAGHGSCLEDKPTENLIVDTIGRNGDLQQPGEIFSEHRQCQLVFGQESKLCSYMPVCRRLWCTTGDADVEGCRTQHMPWADGTPCGDSKWCQKGACVLKDLEKLRVVDGGWGSWGEYGDCSRDCGGGVRRSLRECDSPLPSNGGRYCVGPRVRYESCNTHECTGDSKDFRAEQCSQFNDDNFNIQGLPKDNVQWVPKYSGISPKDRCKLFCRVLGASAYYLLKEKVIDGTPCGPDTFDICVNGACLPAGCDRRLHSRKLLDICGLCGGDGSSCKTQGGSYNESSYGYSQVVRIPAGASSIDIRQTSATSRDDNYLALLDPVTNEYLLNGHFVVSMFRKNVHAAGTLIEYSGSDSTTERINCSRPIQSDLIVQVLSVGKLSRPNIVYQYVISIDKYKYNWKFTGFSECSESCNGVHSPQYSCFRNNELVSDHYCVNSPQSSTNGVKSKSCNTHCKFNWIPTKSVCSTNCGKGYRNVTHTCNAIYVNNTSKTVSEDKCTSVRPDGMEPCHIPCDMPKWRYGPWAPCDSICGDGFQTRTAVCYFNNQVVDAGYCNRSSEIEGRESGANKKSYVRRKCNERDCGAWKIDQWSPCSRTCGEGISRAAYACYLGSTILPPDYCMNSQRPIVERKCDLPPCYIYIVDEFERNNWDFDVQYCDYVTSDSEEDDDASLECKDVVVLQKKIKELQREVKRLKINNMKLKRKIHADKLSKPTTSTVPSPQLVEEEEINRTKFVYELIPGYVSTLYKCHITGNITSTTPPFLCNNNLFLDLPDKPLEEAVVPTNWSYIWKTLGGNLHSGSSSYDCSLSTVKSRFETIRHSLDKKIEVLGSPSDGSDPDDKYPPGWCSSTYLDTIRQFSLIAKHKQELKRVEEVLVVLADKICEKREHRNRTGLLTFRDQFCERLNMRGVSHQTVADLIGPPSTNTAIGHYCSGTLSHSRSVSLEPLLKKWMELDEAQGNKRRRVREKTSTRANPCRCPHCEFIDRNKKKVDKHIYDFHGIYPYVCDCVVLNAPHHCTQCGVNVTVGIHCAVFSNGQTVDDKYCETTPDKPDGVVYCGDCVMPEKARLVMDSRSNGVGGEGLTAAWDIGDWGECRPAQETTTGGNGSSSSSSTYYILSRQVSCPSGSCDAENRPPSMTACGLWSTGKWSDCNVTCGSGKEIRSVQCTLDSVVTKQEFCPAPPPPTTRDCIKTACEWKIGPWGKCSKVCGNGVRIRQVKCSGVKCDERTKPLEYESCSLEPCPLWVTGEWGECSAACGGAVRERSVKCMDFDRVVVEDQKCVDAGVDKPSHSESCGDVDCRETNRVDDTVTYRWKPGVWSNCTKRCGKGHKTREVNCTKLEYSIGKLIATTVVTNEELCRARQKPRARRGCARFPCPFKWISSPWSQCSRECGYGIQERTVTCHRVNKFNWVDPDIAHDCDNDEKPKNYNYCFLADCQDLYRWKTENWTECVTRCGKVSRQKRRVYCIETRSNNRVNANHCKADSKPVRKRKCPVTPCGLTSCQGLPSGNHILLVGGKNLTIYCHEDKEYLNLISEENFSEIYEKRLIRPETCPRGGLRMESCECIQDRNRRSGFTIFSKIRINVTNLRVHADDYDFTRQVTGSPVNFGEAGDCYSSVNCPQGRFSINLNGTGLSVSSDTVWTSSGHRASMWIHRNDSNLVTGKCGGYCVICLYDLNGEGAYDDFLLRLQVTSPLGYNEDTNYGPLYLWPLSIVTLGRTESGNIGNSSSDTTNLGEEVQEPYIEYWCTERESRAALAITLRYCRLIFWLFTQEKNFAIKC